tara:strand:+ start:277 stop:504 length:228 start_codon:yes stop_codon:yes gene_type:complete
MKKEVTVEYDDIVFVLIGEFNKGQYGNYEYPSFSNSFDCHKVLCGGQDIIGILEEHIIEDLERKASEIIDENIRS